MRALCLHILGQRVSGTWTRRTSEGDGEMPRQGNLDQRYLEFKILDRHLRFIQMQVRGAERGKWPRRCWPRMMESSTWVPAGPVTSFATSASDISDVSV
jgi:hypothetical protein